MPQTMTALVQLHDGFATAPGDQSASDLGPYLALETVEVPEPGPGQALIEVARAAVNPSDIAFVKGIYGQPRRKGVPAGFEGTGRVVAGDTDLVGRRVSFFADASGTWAGYALTSASGLIPLRDDIADDDAAGLIVNPITAMGMFGLVREAGAAAFVVTAAGSQLGKFLLGLARDDGVPAIAVVRRAEQVAPLCDAGAADVLDETAPDFGDRLAAAMERHGPTVLLDAVAGDTSARIFWAMPQHARWVVYGRLAAAPVSLNRMEQFIFNQKRIEGFWLTAWMQQTPQDRVAAAIAEAQARFADGRWRTDVSDIVPLSAALTALPEAYAKKDAKVLIDPTS